MIIDRNYVLGRIEQLILEKQSEEEKTQQGKDRLYQIKLRFPKWLRNIVFHPYNPFYSVYLQSKAYKNNDKSKRAVLNPVHPQAVDFVKYCLIQDVVFDTDLYYPQSDVPALARVADNRLKSVLGGHSHVDLDREQQAYYRQVENLKSKVRKTGKGYRLNIEGIDYYLPSDSFSGQTYLNDYGLKFLPAYVKEYIRGKDFLDFGAYIGDASILFTRKYAPGHLYAYEPVADSARLLEETVKMNGIDSITVVEKGAGGKIEEIDIFVDPLAPTSCSINDSMGKNGNETQRIKITTIDNDCKEMHVGLIKMDIEGAEYSALEGGLETIKRDKPVLLISLYHTGKDFFEIPPMLKKAVPEYEFRFLDIDLRYPINEKILAAYLPKYD